MKFEEAVRDFLKQKEIAVVGVSLKKETPANSIYKKLKGSGVNVYAVNPGIGTYNDEKCYPDLKSIPQKVDGVVIVTKPEITEKIAAQCAESEIRRVWIHRSFNFLGSSVSDKAIDICRENNISVIAGGCPMMFCEPVDPAHKCMRWFLKVTKKLPA